MTINRALPVAEKQALDWALAYASMGWRVYPIEPGGKRPLFDGWQRDATTNHILIARHWRSEPGPNVGLICGEAFDVVDVEVAHVEAFRRAFMRHELPDAPLARSGRGGVHVYVAPLGLGTRRLVLDGLHVGEWKGSGGVVAPPSVTHARYAWLRPPTGHPLPEAPAWLRGLAAAPAVAITRRSVGRLTPSRAVALAHGLYRVVAAAPEGERNRLLFWASCRAAEHGLEPSAVADILLAAARQAGLPEREARLTIASGFRR